MERPTKGCSANIWDNKVCLDHIATPATGPVPDPTDFGPGSAHGRTTGWTAEFELGGSAGQPRPTRARLPHPRANAGARDALGGAHHGAVRGGFRPVYDLGPAVTVFGSARPKEGQPALARPMAGPSPFGKLRVLRMRPTTPVAGAGAADRRVDLVTLDLPVGVPK